VIRRPAPRFPYALIFRDFVEYVRILAVAHAKRRPGYRLHRVGDEQQRCADTAVRTAASRASSLRSSPSAPLDPAVRTVGLPHLWLQSWAFQQARPTPILAASTTESRCGFPRQASPASQGMDER
jgi:hypothetical protein